MKRARIGTVFFAGAAVALVAQWVDIPSWLVFIVTLVIGSAMNLEESKAKERL